MGKKCTCGATVLSKFCTNCGKNSALLQSNTSSSSSTPPINSAPFKPRSSTTSSRPISTASSSSSSRPSSIRESPDEFTQVKLRSTGIAIIDDSAVPSRNSKTVVPSSNTSNNSNNGESLICSGCSKPIILGTRFCVSCGRKNEHSVSQASTIVTTSNEKRRSLSPPAKMSSSSTTSNSLTKSQTITPSPSSPIISRDSNYTSSPLSSSNTNSSSSNSFLNIQLRKTPEVSKPSVSTPLTNTSNSIGGSLLVSPSSASSPSPSSSSPSSPSWNQTQIKRPPPKSQSSLAKLCLVCGAVKETKYCTQCGSDDTGAKSSKPLPIPVDLSRFGPKPKCSKCGAPRDTIFCTQCGHKEESAIATMRNKSSGSQIKQSSPGPSKQPIPTSQPQVQSNFVPTPFLVSKGQILDKKTPPPPPKPAHLFPNPELEEDIDKRKTFILSHSNDVPMYPHPSPSVAQTETSRRSWKQRYDTFKRKQSLPSSAVEDGTKKKTPSYANPNLDAKTRVILEIIETEEDYVKDLKILINVFLKPMTDKKHTTREESAAIFSSLQFSSFFLLNFYNFIS